MNYTTYLASFKKAAAQLDTALLHKKGIEVESGIWLNSVVLRLIKKHWANDPFQKPQSGSAIFFSVWLNDAAVKEHKIYYNIHALRLRQLNGYSLTSREFAAGFRAKFKRFEDSWPNVSVSFGPLTLMQGWEKIDLVYSDKIVLSLANKFLKIDGLIDTLLEKYKLSPK